MKVYDLTYPGIAITGNDPVWAMEADKQMYFIGDTFIKLSICGNLAESLRAEKQARGNLRHQGQTLPPLTMPSDYALSLIFIYSEAFATYLDRLRHLLEDFFKDPKFPSFGKFLAKEMDSLFGGVKDVRDSGAHFNERIHQKAFKKPIIPEGGRYFVESINSGRLQSTSEKGKTVSVSPSEETLTTIQTFLQKLIDSFEWEGGPANLIKDNDIF